MSKAHFILPSGATPKLKTVRLGAGTGSGNNLSTADEGKVVKLVAESRYDLAVVGDPIEGVIYAVEPATSAGFSIGGICQEEEILVTFDGLQATPGTGVVTIGSLVVAGSITAKGTALGAYPKVCMATSQAVTAFLWRVESLGTVGTGAVGTTGTISRV